MSLLGLHREGPLKWITLFDTKNKTNVHLLHVHDIMHCIDGPGTSGWVAPVEGSSYNIEFIAHGSDCADTADEALAILRAKVQKDFDQSTARLAALDQRRGILADNQPNPSLK